MQRWLLLASTILTAITGLVYWYMKNLMEPMSEWAAINHPLQPWMLKAHILVSPVLVFAVGWIAGSHILRHLQEKRRVGRWSGLLSIWIWGPMVFSGYLIQTVTREAWLDALVWVHLATGVLFLLGVAAHQWVVTGRFPKRRRGAVEVVGSRGDPEE